MRQSWSIEKKQIVNKKGIRKIRQNANNCRKFTGVILSKKQIIDKRGIRNNPSQRYQLPNGATILVDKIQSPYKKGPHIYTDKQYLSCFFLERPRPMRVHCGIPNCTSKNVLFFFRFCLRGSETIHLAFFGIGHLREQDPCLGKKNPVRGSLAAATGGKRGTLDRGSLAGATGGNLGVVFIIA